VAARLARTDVVAGVCGFGHCCRKLKVGRRLTLESCAQLWRIKWSVGLLRHAAERRPESEE